MLSPYRAGPSAQAGFTLIELMVVLVITGVLMAVAVPSYQAHMRRGYRAEAMAALLELQHFMERHYSVYGRYLTSAEVPPVLPARLQQVPQNAPARYVLSAKQTTATSYTLQAEPVGALAGDKCGVLSLTHTGVKGSALPSPSDCWR